MQNSEEILNEEYEAQYFGFLPSDFSEGSENLIRNRFEEVINKLDAHFSKILILSDEERQEGLQKLKAHTTESIDNIAIKLKSHLSKNIVKIPPSVVLPEDDVHTADFSSTDVQDITKEIEELKKQIKAEKYVKEVLKAELKDIEVVSRAQEGVLVAPHSQKHHLAEVQENVSFLEENMKVAVASMGPVLNENEETKDCMKSIYETEVFK